MRDIAYGTKQYKTTPLEVKLRRSGSFPFVAYVEREFSNFPVFGSNLTLLNISTNLAGWVNRENFKSCSIKITIDIFLENTFSVM